MFIPAVCGEPGWTCKSVIIRHFTWLLQKKLKYFLDFYCGFCICVVYLHIKVLQSDEPDSVPARRAG